MYVESLLNRKTNFEKNSFHNGSDLGSTGRYSKNKCCILHVQIMYNVYVITKFMYITYLDLN